MALPVVKQKYTHLQAMEAMDFLESYIAVNKIEASNAIIYRILNPLQHSIQCHMLALNMWPYTYCVNLRARCG